MPTTYPATPKQLAFIATLQAERNLPVGAKDGLSKSEASALISALMDLPKPQASLTDMAKAIETGTPVVAAQPVVVDEEDYEAVAAEVLVFNREECKALRSAISVAIGETDGTAMDHALYERIDAWLSESKAPVAPAAKPASLNLDNASAFVPEGHYAITGNDGTTDFYRVQYGKPGGKWDGFLFLSQQVSDDYVAVKSPSVKLAVIAKVAADTPLVAAQRYGHELGVCGICHKTLTDPQSIADGIGPVCKAKIGG